TARHVYVCGGGVANPTLMSSLHTLLAQQNRQCHSIDVLQLNPQWIEAAAFAWLAACWCNQVPSNPHRATGANRPVVLGAGYWA
ncbi:anhydro-N-acetylmuramic acid kinase, partial [Vibrio alginolyticus]|nr:anhydro-N-acetylmuramic acid kinase [Vibrio alginolyticus]